MTTSDPTVQVPTAKYLMTHVSIMIAQDGDSNPAAESYFEFYDRDRPGFQIRSILPADMASAMKRTWEYDLKIINRSPASGYINGEVVFSAVDVNDTFDLRSNVYAIIEDLNNPVYTIW